ncbi:DNA/RNA non-specific endonuclease [Streptococcus vestibularis]|uniref:DNA/RNA non-specific endonuclease n=1 Tax=Streptococcus vestibularis TaxID=1343 RepID=UPI00232B3F8B|nr:DNA/RNA non-specific endonuclease [Streptococcus vestibularis]HEO2476408.1 DNA/RNA non-specific endonuclease [Streptococcus agalactiae]MDB6183548.1 DNA/RNA non-specific endonuclease [Streptococcus vestibularis]MDB6201225.1 DNA/RNA non-specific endonuclease [Streptococcus vestibularis]MDB6206980.1 DNA/RNA non-specific endonuclease [Streptococcus vestibularis]MDB6210778.1 DNA/RNA non-specific endonuclease [Streptococcus vestibularis]
MKRGKFAFVAILFIAIILIQPSNREGLVLLFSQRDIGTQLGWVQSPEEQKSQTSAQHDDQNAELKKKLFEGQQVITVNDKAQFSSDELSLNQGTWQRYSDLDFLNRVGVAEAMLGQDLMPTEKRGDISSVTPTGWKNKKIVFNGQTDYLYNRSHLIGYQLTGQNANVRNLFTGTRALNANFEDEKNSMVYYENLVANYIKETGNHVRYRVTPLFKNVELVCRGVRIEAQSIEDDTISYDVYIFNVQPDYTINYLTGNSQKNN